jgi:hypothetical protein
MDHPDSAQHSAGLPLIAGVGSISIERMFDDLDRTLLTLDQ